MDKTISLVAGAGLGAGLMYFLDPDRGKRRRVFIRDKTIRLSRKTRQVAGSTSRDMRNRAKGITASLKSWMRPDLPVSDQILVERIRSKLGMISCHPASIEVHVQTGVVTLSGPVLRDEADNILAAVGRIHGVVRVENRLELHETPADIPALQGTSARKPGPRFELLQANWSPTARLLTAMMGSAALLYGLRQPTVAAATVAIGGLGLLIRSITNREFVRC